MILPGITPITGRDAADAGTRNTSAGTGARCTDAPSGGGGNARPAKLSAVTGSPRRSTRLTAQPGRSSSSSTSARYPGAISPRSRKPKPRAADQLAAR